MDQEFTAKSAGCVDISYATDVLCTWCGLHTGMKVSCMDVLLGVALYGTSSHNHIAYVQSNDRYWNEA